MINEWVKTPLYWKASGVEHISIPFTYQLPAIREYIIKNGNCPVVGGTAVKLLPDYLADVAIIGKPIPGMLQYYNPKATRTTIGCPRGVWVLCCKNH